MNKMLKNYQEKVRTKSSNPNGLEPLARTL
jgi:hypothetical protein